MTRALVFWCQLILSSAEKNDPDAWRGEDYSTDPSDARNVTNKQELLLTELKEWKNVVVASSSRHGTN